MQSRVASGCALLRIVTADIPLQPYIGITNNVIEATNDNACNPGNLHEAGYVNWAGFQHGKKDEPAEQ